MWESATGKSLSITQKENARFKKDCLASTSRTALLRCDDTVGMQFLMLFVHKDDRPDPIPGLVNSSVDGQRMLIKTEKDKVYTLTVMKVSTARGKDETGPKLTREPGTGVGNESANTGCSGGAGAHGSTVKRWASQSDQKRLPGRADRCLRTDDPEAYGLNRMVSACYYRRIKTR